jgi:phosphonate transport system substrate-binding protein
MKKGLIFLVCSIGLLGGCGKSTGPDHAPEYAPQAAAPSAAVEYVFAVHPLHNPTRLFQVYQPLMDYINSQTKEFVLKLEASENYAAFEKKLAQRQMHFALPNPYQTLQAESHGYRVFGKMGDDERFRGIILVRKDAGIREVSDLKGAAISFPAPTALAAAQMPKYYLKQHGLDVEKECDCRYVGSQESSIMNVYQGQTKAGCTWPPPWESLAKEKPELVEALEVKWQTEPLINNSLMVRDDVPTAHVQIVSAALFNLHTTSAGREVLARINLSRFEAATTATYEPVRDFIKKYEGAFTPKIPGRGTP